MLYQVLRKLFTLSLYVGIGFGIVACDRSSETPESMLATPTNTTNPMTKSINANLSGVQIAVGIPEGWYGSKMDGGILIAEQRGSMHNSGKLLGMQIYVFVHSISSFPPDITSDDHPAQSILERIVTQPSMVGDSAVSHPETFTWDGNDAAYYLLNDKNKNVSLVMAVMLTDQAQLVAINISCPRSKADAIRKALPELLDELWVNNTLMSTTVLDALPDPLLFPKYPEQVQTVTP